MIFREKVHLLSSSMRNCMSGLPAFILGNGPSVNDNDLKNIDGYFSIGTNRIFQVYEPTILFWQDTQINQNHEREIDKCMSMKFCRRDCNQEEKYISFDLCGSSFSLSDSPLRLNGRGCSGVLAAEFAISLGCSHLVLIGCDGVYSNGRSDFYGNNRDHNNRTLSNFSSSLQWLKENSPVPIRNCGLSSLWKREDIKDVILDLNPRKHSKMFYFARIFR